MQGPDQLRHVRGPRELERYRMCLFTREKTHKHNEIPRLFFVGSVVFRLSSRSLVGAVAIECRWHKFTRRL